MEIAQFGLQDNTHVNKHQPVSKLSLSAKLWVMYDRMANLDPVHKYISQKKSLKHLNGELVSY